MTSSFRKAIPWWMRISTKIALARLPIPYSYWKNLRLFEHGDMNQPQRALDNFVEHVTTGGMFDVKSQLLQLQANSDDFTVLELGPGDSLFTSVIARSYGASRCWLVDSGAYAGTNMEPYVTLFGFLQNRGFKLPFGTNIRSLPDVLQACGAEYLTEGVSSLTKLPATSVDFCFSNAVLEHIPKDDFTKLANELARVLKPNGVCVHRVDLKDHLGGSLNNLRFSDSTWEGRLFRNSGFYTNRIRCSQMIKAFESVGFECKLPRIIRWNVLPLSRSKLDTSFRSLPSEDLLISDFDVVLRPVHRGT
jgi:SAM-dependent methyltransferase